MDSAERPDRIRVEVAYALPDEQVLLALTVQDGHSVEQVLERSGIYARFPAEDLRGCEVGIWGVLTTRNTRPGDGDRIELYRPLVRDPRDARRVRAKD